MTSIQSYNQPSTVTVQAFENNGARTISSFGPKNILRLKSDATMWSLSGAQLSLKSLGANSLLLAKELRLVQPLEIRFKRPSHPPSIVYPNAYMDEYGTPFPNGGGVKAANLQADSALQIQDSLFSPPLALASSMQNLVLTCNGTSWQTRPAAWMDFMKKLYLEARFDEEGATMCPPFNNCGANKGLDQPGLFQRCLNLNKKSYIKHVTYDQNGDVDDVLFQYDLVTKLPVGPFLYSAFPSLTNLTENSLQALPHIQDLSVEYTLKSTNPLLDWFKHPSTELKNSQSIDVASRNFGAVASNMNVNNAGAGGIDAFHMWNTAVAREESIANDPSICLNLMRPFLSYQMVEPNLALIPPRSLYTIPSARFVTYQKEVAIAADKEVGRVVYDYIKVDSLSSLVVINVCESDKDGANGAVGGRQARWRGPTNVPAGYNNQRRGMAWSNVMGKIRWDTLNINLSIRNQTLGSLTAGPETKRDMHRIFLKYSKTKCSYEDWEKYNQMIIFSPQELCGAGFALSEAPLVLSVSFDVERTCCDTEYTPRDFCANLPYNAVTHANDLHRVNLTQYPRWIGRAVNLTASLNFFQEEWVQFSPGKCGITMARFTAAEAASGFAAAGKALEEPVLDQFIN